MTTIKDITGSPLLLALVIGGLAYITVFSVVYLLKARKRALEMGISSKEISDIIKSSLIFSIVPSLSIVIGLVALAASLGTVWAWWRLSVIGSLSFETQIASSLAPVLGYANTTELMSSATGEQFGVVMILMSVGMLSGFLILIPFGKKLMTSVDKTKGGNGWSNVLSGCFMLTLLAVYVPVLLISDTIQALVMITGLIVAIVLGIVAKKPGWGWVNNFIMAGSMILGMVSSLLWTTIF
ncbi:MAG: DUF5058 family protein [Eubacteriales bacterium]|nr:DUF5058 family protein [Eubacteriales bacterium]